MPQPIGLGVHDTTKESRKVGRIGEKVEPFNDGRVFQLCRSGAAINAFEMTCQATAVSDHTDLVVGDDAVLGAKTMTVDLGSTAITANQYDFVAIIDGAGEGQLLRIESHPAADASATSVELRLLDALRTAVATSTSKASLRHHKCDQVVQAPADAKDAPTGVSQVAVAAADTFFLAQIKGRSQVLASGALVAGGPVGVGGAAGAVKAIAETGSGAYSRSDGVADEAAATTEFGGVDLNV